MKTENIFRAVSNLKIGDEILINDWTTYMKVCGVSKSFVVAYNDDTDEYTIISKIPNDHTYNNVKEGCCYCGPDWWSMGYWEGYHFNDTGWVDKYLASLESRETEISERNRAEIYLIKVMSDG